MEDSSYRHEYYLDLETGEILFTSEQIPKAEPREGYEDMEAFVATVEDEHLAELLKIAINGKGAFRRFKDALLRYPEERERWFQFKGDRMWKRAREWLDDIGVTLI